MTAHSELVARTARGLSAVQREKVERGCLSGDLTMATVKALKRKGLFELVISSPNGQCGFMELTPLGHAVRASLLPSTATGPQPSDDGEKT